MAEEKKTPAKVEESKLTKVLNWFRKLPGRIAKPFKNMVAELKKVTWPSRKKWISSSIAVLVFMVFMGVVIGLLDLGATALVKTMIGNTSDATVVETVDETVDEVVEATETPEAEATEVPAE
ncbi:MAG: preprotein translocase subunit SecE [Aristaeellaceae bacterium]